MQSNGWGSNSYEAPARQEVKESERERDSR
jgi:hypothetical protein